MKSANVTTRLKKRFGLTTNDEIEPAIETALAAKTMTPMGMTIIISGNGSITPVPFGLSNPPTVQQTQVLQQVLRQVADWMDEQKLALVRAEALAQAKASVLKTDEKPDVLNTLT